MHVRFLWATVAAALAVCGCQSGDHAPAKMGTAPRDQASETTPSGQKAAPNPEAGSTPVPDPREPKTTTKPDQQLKVTPPRTDQWKPAPSPAQDFAAEADRSLQSLQNAYLSAMLIVENTELKGSIGAEWNYFSRAKHRIEFQIPTDPTKMRIFMARDGRRVQNDGDGIKPFSRTLPPGSGMLDTFPARFPEFFSIAAATGAELWTPLVRAANSNKAYAVSFESKPMDVGGTSIEFKRLVIQPKSRPGELWEIRFDGTRKLPVTFKIQGPKGSSQWNLRWSFSKPLDEAKIQLPKQ